MHRLACYAVCTAAHLPIAWDRDVCLLAIQAVHCDTSCWAMLPLTCRTKFRRSLTKPCFNHPLFPRLACRFAASCSRLGFGHALRHVICLSSITAHMQAAGNFLFVGGLIFPHVYADTQYLGRARVGICIRDGHSSHDSVSSPACKKNMCMDNIAKSMMRMRSAFWVACCCCCNAQLLSCCRIKSGESEEIKIPRAPPRISADRLSDHIIKSLKL